jgi:hypothetical protein
MRHYRKTLRDRLRFRPVTEELEGRQVRSVFGANGFYTSQFGSSRLYARQAAYAEHKLHQYVSKLQRVELQSRATPAQFLALRDDAHAIAEEASSQPHVSASAAESALAVTIQLDRAPFEGWLGEPGWRVVRSNLEVSLTALGVDHAVIDKTLADMQSTARSAGVSYEDNVGLAIASDAYQDARLRVPSGYGSFPDAQTYYTQHLRGFFRGLATARLQSAANLNADVRAIELQSNATPAQAAVVSRDARILKNLGATVTETKNAALGDAFVATFSDGLPTATDQANLRATAGGNLRQSAGASQRAQLETLVADAPTLFEALGSSQANVRTLVAHVQTVVANGADAYLNPFKVVVR